MGGVPASEALWAEHELTASKLKASKQKKRAIIGPILAAIREALAREPRRKLRMLSGPCIGPRLRLARSVWIAEESKISPKRRTCFRDCIQILRSVLLRVGGDWCMAAAVAGTRFLAGHSLVLSKRFLGIASSRVRGPAKAEAFYTLFKSASRALCSRAPRGPVPPSFRDAGRLPRRRGGISMKEEVNVFLTAR